MSKTQSNVTSNSPQSYLNATGKIPHNMTNDYMFRAILQKNTNVLRGLIGSILHIPPKEITDIYIKNPILLGASLKEKAFVLDIHVCINNHTIINLEMQVINEHNWPERSLSYLCHIFRQLTQGQNYCNIKPVIHIGFLDFQPFENNLEFFAMYKLLNVRNHKIYSDKFALGVIDLTHIDLATDEDKTYHIDHWAKLFKATTWEDIKMIATENEYMEEAIQTLYECNADEIIREQCIARAEEIASKNYYIQALAERDATLAEKDAELATKNAELEATHAELAQLRAQLAELKKA